MLSYAWCFQIRNCNEEAREETAPRWPQQPQLPRIKLVTHTFATPSAKASPSYQTLNVTLWASRQGRTIDVGTVRHVVGYSWAMCIISRPSGSHTHSTTASAPLPFSKPRAEHAISCFRTRQCLSWPPPSPQPGLGGSRCSKALLPESEGQLPTLWGNRCSHIQRQRSRSTVEATWLLDTVGCRDIYIYCICKSSNCMWRGESRWCKGEVMTAVGWFLGCFPPKTGSISVSEFSGKNQFWFWDPVSEGWFCRSRCPSYRLLVHIVTTGYFYRRRRPSQSYRNERKRR